MSVFFSKTRAKRLLALGLCLLALPLGARTARGAEGVAPPALYAGAAVLMDAETGQVLFEKNGRERMHPASLTKIMTCLLAMEEGDPRERVAMTAEGLALMPGAAALGLVAGESLTMAQMLYAAMLPSANDASNAVAIHLAGSREAFAREMNRKAWELGLSGTSFANAHGLPEEGHYSTAYDLAEITRAALRHPEFLDYAGRRSYAIPATRANYARSFSHLNRALLPGGPHYDPRAVAGKTGWTVAAGSCLMTVAERDGVRLIAIVLKSDAQGVEGAVYRDTRALLDYGFSAFRRVELPLPGVELEADLPDASGEVSGYLLTARGGDRAFLLPQDLREEEVALKVVSPEGGSTAEPGRLWGRVALVDQGTGEILLEAGRAPLAWERLAPEPLGPARPAFSPEADPRGALPKALAGALVCGAALLLGAGLRRRRGSSPTA